MNYKYMKTSKIDVQGSIVISSLSQGDATIDLTGNYDIDDIATLLDGYMIINEDNPDNGELGLRNGFTDLKYLDVEEITIKKATVSFDITKFNNLLKLLGFSNGRVLYTTDQTFDEFDTGWGIVYSPYMGGKIPLEFSIPGNSLACGFSTSVPITIKNGGKDSVSNVGVYSNNYRVRRGEEATFRGTKIFVDLIDVLKDIYKAPVKWYSPAGYDFYTTKGYILLPHRTFESSLIYPTIGVREVVISFLEEA